MKILVVDHHVLIREALRGVLKELRGDITVLEAADSRQAMEIVAAEQGDLGLILLDLNLPDRDGFAVLSELWERYPAISVVVLSARLDHDRVLKALDRGARGFIPKSAQRDVILGALRLVIAGGVYIPPEAIPTKDSPSPKPTVSRLGAETAHVTPADLGLTGRQLDVLALLMQGKGNKAICSPQRQRLRKSQRFLTPESNRSAPDEPADEAGA
jgi:DNA-binding NarL/FixJ family response regulator